MNAVRVVKSLRAGVPTRISTRWLPVLNTQELVTELGSQPIRTYVRAALEALDIKYVYNETVKMQATELSEQSLDEDETFLVFADDNG